MNAITTVQMRELEQQAFAAGITAGALMEQAGLGIAQEIVRLFPQPGSVLAFLGKGHNAGDALVALRWLRQYGWKVSVRSFYPEVEWATLTRQNHRLCGEMDDFAEFFPTLILDGLVGIGFHGELREPLRAAAKEIQQWRMDHGIPVVALDVPSGVDADSGTAVADAVVADVTLMIGAPKTGLLSEQAVHYVGRLGLIPLPGISSATLVSHRRLITPKSFPRSLSPRAHEFHKGNAGRVAVIAGSLGMEGAALMTATAALRAGAGLVTLFVPNDIRDAIVARATPELMVKACDDLRDIEHDHYDAFVLGPGMGAIPSEKFAEIEELLTNISCAGVLDADALNAIAHHQGHHVLQRRHVVTPHPGEFARFAPESHRRGREQGCLHFAEYCAPVLLLKGARTLVAQRGYDLYHNSTGHAGMATGGMGDVLAGVIGGLIAQGIPPFVAACCSAWVCGRAAEIAVEPGSARRSVLATDLYGSLAAALHEWQRGI